MGAAIFDLHGHHVVSFDRLIKCCENDVEGVCRLTGLATIDADSDDSFV